MESNAAVTLNFEDLVVNNYFFFQICVHAFVKNLKLFY